MFDFIAKKRAGALYLFKDELGGNPVSSIVSTSPKQYIILELAKDLSLPLDNDTVAETTSFKKAKGVHRGLIAEQLTIEDFRSVGIVGDQGRRVDQYSFKKYMFDVFLHKTRRLILSRGNTKRLFLQPYKTEESFFSLPLFAKHLPQWSSIIFYSILLCCYYYGFFAFVILTSFSLSTNLSLSPKSRNTFLHSRIRWQLQGVQHHRWHRTILVMRSLAPDSYLTALRMMPLSYPRIGNFLSKNNHQHAVVSHLDSFAFNIVFSLLPVNSLTHPRIPPISSRPYPFLYFFLFLLPTGSQYLGYQSKAGKNRQSWTFEESNRPKSSLQRTFGLTTRSWIGVWLSKTFFDS